MYVPKHFQNHDAEAIKAFIHENSFATLISVVNGKLWATHIPLFLNNEGTKLSGHVSQANLQGRNFVNDDEVMAVFQGPHAYISSSWYNHENVPTWNYIAIHAYGKIKILTKDEMIESLRLLVDKYEKGKANAVSVDTMSKELLHKNLQGVIGFEISITELNASFKLSQNRDNANQELIIKELEKLSDPNSKTIASEMKKRFTS